MRRSSHRGISKCPGRQRRQTNEHTESSFQRLGEQSETGKARRVRWMRKEGWVLQGVMEAVRGAVAFEEAMNSSTMLQEGMLMRVRERPDVW